MSLTVLPVCVLSFVVILPISIFALIKLTWFRKKKSNIENTSKFLYVNQIVFYVSCILFGIGIPFTQIFTMYSIEWRIIMAIETFFHGLLHFWTLICIFYGRLTHVFNGTPLALSNKTKLIFNTLFIIVIIMGVVIYIIVLTVTENNKLLILLSIPYLFCMIGITQFLSFMFVYKLYKINREVDNQSNAADITPTINKFTVLSVISMSGTLFFILLIGMLSSINIKWRSTTAFMKQIDITTDLICVSLSYSFFSTYYNKLCYICDIGFKRCCQAPQDIQLASITIAKTRKLATARNIGSANVSTSVIDRKQFLKENKLNGSGVADIFNKHDITIEELMEFSATDLVSFAEEIGLNTLYKNRFINAINGIKKNEKSKSATPVTSSGGNFQRVRPKSITSMDESHAAKSITSFDKSQPDDPKSMNEPDFI